MHATPSCAYLPVVIRARLPPLYVITPEPVEVSEFLHRLECILDAGARLVQLRAKTLETKAYSRLAERAHVLCKSHGATLLLNAPPALVSQSAAMGVHLTSARLMGLRERPLAQDKWVAASCHTDAELAQAARIGVDFVVISPVLATASHPHAQALGWDGLRNLVEQAEVPVYALGGMKPAHLAQALHCGAQGIAAISAVWDAKDLGMVMQPCLAE